MFRCEGEVSASLIFKKCNNMEIKEIEKLIEKQRLTAEDKAAVKEEADRLGIAYTLKQGCRSCYDKLLLKIYDAHREEVASAVSLDGYRLKNPLHGFRTTPQSRARLSAGCIRPSCANTL